MRYLIVICLQESGTNEESGSHDQAKLCSSEGHHGRDSVFVLR
jgi:hypothetical protein